MPRPPRSARCVSEMPGAIFSRIAHKLAAHEGEIFPLHIGDTWMEPVAGARMEDLRVERHPGMHRYGPPKGLPALTEALAAKLRARNGMDVAPENILVTAGATGGLAAAVGMLADPGDEVLILSPFWPLIRGIVTSWRATPVEVPFYDRVDGPEAAVEAVREKLSPRTVALYVSTPSNPSGRVIPKAWLEALAEFARAHNLWLLSDETYEDLVYAGEHASIGAFAPERTLTVFTFSKSYGMAGNRVGYLVGPAAVIPECRKISIHTFYSAPTGGQLAALRALESGDAWLAEARESYRGAGAQMARALGLPPAEGSTFYFLDVSAQLDERGVFGFLEDAVDDGLVLAPGPSFGQGYENHVRICFTSAPPDRVAEASRRLARRLGRDPS